MAAAVDIGVRIRGVARTGAAARSAVVLDLVVDVQDSSVVLPVLGIYWAICGAIKFVAPGQVPALGGCTWGQNTGENGEHQRCSDVDGATQSSGERTPASMTRAPSGGTEDHSAPNPSEKGNFNFEFTPGSGYAISALRLPSIGTQPGGSLHRGARWRELIPRSRNHSSFGRGSDFRNSARSDLSWSDSPRLKQLS